MKGKGGDLSIRQRFGLKFVKSFIYQENYTKLYIVAYLFARKVGVKKSIGYRTTAFKCSCGYRFYAYLSDYWRFASPSEHFEPLTTRFLASVVDSDDVVLDIGAHIGIHTVHMARRARLVIAVEPEPYNLSLLIRNIKLNSVAKKVVVLPVAACDYDGDALLYLHESSGGHSLKPVGEKTVKVKCRRLDSLLNDGLGIDRVDVTKVDVEGYEGHVLRGLEGIFSRNPPRVLVVEIDKNSYIVDYVRRRYSYRKVVILDSWGDRVNVAFLR